MASRYCRQDPARSSEHRPGLRRHQHRHARTFPADIIRSLAKRILGGRPAQSAGPRITGKFMRSQIGTTYGTPPGCATSQTAEGYISSQALMRTTRSLATNTSKPPLEQIKKGRDANEAYKEALATYGRFSSDAGAVKYIDPRHE